MNTIRTWTARAKFATVLSAAAMLGCAEFTHAAIINDSIEGETFNGELVSGSNDAGTASVNVVSLENDNDGDPGCDGDDGKVSPVLDVMSRDVAS